MSDIYPARIYVLIPGNYPTFFSLIISSTKQYYFHIVSIKAYVTLVEQLLTTILNTNEFIRDLIGSSGRCVVNRR